MLNDNDGSPSGTPGSSFEQVEEAGSDALESSINTVQSAAGTGSKMALRPKEPIMGAITQTDTDKWLVWTGGKSKADLDRA
jgi:hypothetical protein